MRPWKTTKTTDYKISISNINSFTIKILLSSIQTKDKRRYKIHLDVAAVKDFNVFIWIKAGSKDLGRTSKVTEQYVNKPQNYYFLSLGVVTQYICCCWFSILSLCYILSLYLFLIPCNYLFTLTQCFCLHFT